jgi:uncharacterized membrane protein HdeD (DUF308 family)
MLATLLLEFSAILFHLGANVADQYFETTASLVVIIAVGTTFVYMGTAEVIVAFQFGMRHNRELWSYLALGLVSFILRLYLAMLRDGFGENSCYSCLSSRSLFPHYHKLTEMSGNS